MAHKTLIGGTAYEIGGGKTLVNGTAYSIDKGKTLVGGTAYEVGFEPEYDPETLLLMHCEDMTDSSMYNRSISGGSYGNPGLNATCKFGSYSFYMDYGSGFYCTGVGSSWKTIDFWVYPMVIDNNDNNLKWICSVGTNYNFVHGGGGFGFTNVNGSSFPLTTGANYPSNTWHHIALMYNGTTLDLYVNGVYQGGLSASSVTYPTFGYKNNTRYFRGCLDEIRVSSCRRWDTNFAPPTAPYTGRLE